MHKLIVVLANGQVQESTFIGYHAESVSDRLFLEEKARDTVTFAATFYCDGGVSPKTFIRQYYVADFPHSSACMSL